MRRRGVVWRGAPPPHGVLSPRCCGPAHSSALLSPGLDSSPSRFRPLDQGQPSPAALTGQQRCVQLPARQCHGFTAPGLDPGPLLRPHRRCGWPSTAAPWWPSRSLPRWASRAKRMPGTKGEMQLPPGTFLPCAAAGLAAGMPTRPHAGRLRRGCAPPGSPTATLAPVRLPRPAPVPSRRSGPTS